MPLCRLVGLCCVALFAAMVACIETTPTTPSPVVSFEGPGFQTALVCPEGVDRVINVGQEVSVSFPAPTIAGQEAGKATCTPASGSVFPVGTTTVTCSATAAADLATNCTFAVRVALRQLAITKIVAFGDSITTGTVSQALAQSTLAGTPLSYPAQLEGLLQDRYPEQNLEIVNAGSGGEDSSEGRARLPGVLNTFRPEVLLLLEGVNRLELVGPENVASDLDAMVATAQSSGVAVLLATLTPVGDIKEIERPGLRTAIDDLNQQIRQIAQDRQLGPVVDLFSLFERTPSLIGRDGLHPTANGYQVMADEFRRAIVSRWELSEGPVLSWSRPAVKTALDSYRR